MTEMITPYQVANIVKLESKTSRSWTEFVTSPVGGVENLTKDAAVTALKGLLDPTKDSRSVSPRESNIPLEPGVQSRIRQVGRTNAGCVQLAWTTKQPRLGVKFR